MQHAEISDERYRELYPESLDVFEQTLSERTSDQNFEYAVSEILRKRLKYGSGLTPQELATLLLAVQHKPIESVRAAIIDVASSIRTKCFANKVAPMVPIEVSSYCASNCTFCGWRVDNRSMIRLSITEKAIREQARVLATKGFCHFEIAGGDDLRFLKEDLPRLIGALKSETKEIIEDARVSLCLVPMNQKQYQGLADVGLDCVLTWQETYNEPSYYSMITSGPKAWGITENYKVRKPDPVNNGYMDRLKSQEMAIRAGLQVGLGTMIGVDKVPEADIMAAVAHGQMLIDHYQDAVKPIIIGMPAWNAIPTEDTDNRDANNLSLDVEKNFPLLASLYLLAFPNKRSWVFANGRVTPETQIESVRVASNFTSTLVRIAPGAYLNDSKETAISAELFKRVKGIDRDELNLSTILEGEQFSHSVGTHDSFMGKFGEIGLEFQSDREMLASAVEHCKNLAAKRQSEMAEENDAVPA